MPAIWTITVNKVKIAFSSAHKYVIEDHMARLEFPKLFPIYSSAGSDRTEYWGYVDTTSLRKSNRLTETELLHFMNKCSQGLKMVGPHEQGVVQGESGQFKFAWHGHDKRIFSSTILQNGNKILIVFKDVFKHGDDAEKIFHSDGETSYIQASYEEIADRVAAAAEYKADDMEAVLPATTSSLNDVIKYALAYDRYLLTYILEDEVFTQQLISEGKDSIDILHLLIGMWNPKRAGGRYIDHVDNTGVNKENWEPIFSDALSKLNPDQYGSVRFFNLLVNIIRSNNAEIFKPLKDNKDWGQAFSKLDPGQYGPKVIFNLLVTIIRSNNVEMLKALKNNKYWGQAFSDAMSGEGNSPLGIFFDSGSIDPSLFKAVVDLNPAWLLDLHKDGGSYFLHLAKYYANSVAKGDEVLEGILKSNIQLLKGKPLLLEQFVIVLSKEKFSLEYFAKLGLRDVLNSKFTNNGQGEIFKIITHSEDIQGAITLFYDVLGSNPKTGLLKGLLRPKMFNAVGQETILRLFNDISPQTFLARFNEYRIVNGNDPRVYSLFLEQHHGDPMPILGDLLAPEKFNPNNQEIIFILFQYVSPVDFLARFNEYRIVNGNDLRVYSLFLEQHHGDPMPILEDLLAPEKFNPNNQEIIFTLFQHVPQGSFLSIFNDYLTVNGDDPRVYSLFLDKHRSDLLVLLRDLLEPGKFSPNNQEIIFTLFQGMSRETFLDSFRIYQELNGDDIRIYGLFLSKCPDDLVTVFNKYDASFKIIDNKLLAEVLDTLLNSDFDEKIQCWKAIQEGGNPLGVIFKTEEHALLKTMIDFRPTWLLDTDAGGTSYFVHFAKRCFEQGDEALEVILRTNAELLPGGVPVQFITKLQNKGVSRDYLYKISLTSRLANGGLDAESIKKNVQEQGQRYAHQSRYSLRNKLYGITSNGIVGYITKASLGINSVVRVIKLADNPNVYDALELGTNIVRLVCMSQPACAASMRAAYVVIAAKFVIDARSYDMGVAASNLLYNLGIIYLNPALGRFEDRNLYVKTVSLVGTAVRSTTNLIHSVIELKEIFTGETKKASKEFVQSEYANTQYNLGLKFYLKEQFDKAKEAFEKAANQGHREAQYRLGLIFLREGNNNEAKKWFLEAVKQEHLDAHYALGNIFFEEGEFDEAGRLLLKAAKQGHEGAQNHLELALQNGANVDGAHEWLMQVKAKKGDLDAQYEMGVALRKAGRIDKAMELFEKSAEQGHSEAQYTLGSIAYGDGESEMAVAEYWFKKAALQGHRDAQYELSIILKKKGFIVEAEEWTIKAAKQGHPSAQYNLGNKFYKENNIAEAKKWFKKAALQGNANAQYNLGVIFYKVENNIAKAKKWFEKAALQGHADGQYNLGLMFYKTNNITEAKKWFEKAALQGHVDAQYNLDVLNDKDESGEGDQVNKIKALVSTESEDAVLTSLDGLLSKLTLEFATLCIVNEMQASVSSEIMNQCKEFGRKLCSYIVMSEHNCNDKPDDHVPLSLEDGVVTCRNYQKFCTATPDGDYKFNYDVFRTIIEHEDL